MDMPDWLHRNAGLFSPERLELLVEVERLFEQLDYDYHTPQLEQVDSDTGESSEITARIELQLQDHLRNVAAQHGVIITSVFDVPLRQVLHIVQAIVSLGHEFNADVLVEHFEDDADPEWILSTWMSQVTAEHYPVGQLALMIDRVEPTLIEAINRRLNRLGDAVDQSEVAARYRAFIGERREGVVYEFIRRRKALPHYFIHTAKAIGPEIANLPLSEQIVFEWVSLALSSELPVDGLADPLRDAMESNLLPEQFAECYSQVINQLMELNRDQV